MIDPSSPPTLEQIIADLKSRISTYEGNTQSERALAVNRDSESAEYKLYQENQAKLLKCEDDLEKLTGKRY